jgi:uncharacterized membrane protein (UPF0127 family)
MSSGQSRLGNRIIVAILLFTVSAMLSHAVSAYFIPARAVLHLGSGRFEIEIADTDRKRQKGLSGTKSLPANKALFFVFDYDNHWPIWMKDMNYPIDIVWLNDSKEVVDFYMNVPPDSYPTRTFTPKEEARYVVEFKAGTIQEQGIRVGQEAVISGTSKKY